MHSIEDDADINTTIPQAHLDYIRCIPDTHQQYARFFDALLIPQRSHAAFFRDLRDFRSLPTTIQALTSCDPEDATITKEQRKKNYRDVTSRFLGSRYAHPWCRKAVAGAGSSNVTGWWGAQWSATGKGMNKEQREQEEKLHALLIPLWVCFRNRMFPGDMVVQEWWEKQQMKQRLVQESDAAISSLHSIGGDKSMPRSHTEELHMTKLSRGLSDDDGDDDEEEDDTDHDSEHGYEDQKSQASSAMTGLLRVAAAGMLIKSLPKMQQWKLKRELKRHRA